ncbi:hypothetical protein BaRGS_00024193 [Batillaria attramentaria]|uniref:Uncharacterized protein n=1 Tax=Batillaria attramentaria TaxID=370345 RepID=A0ABD0KBW2_9CAEN
MILFVFLLLTARPDNATKTKLRKCCNFREINPPIVKLANAGHCVNGFIAISQRKSDGCDSLENRATPLGGKLKIHNAEPSESYEIEVNVSE